LSQASLGFARALEATIRQNFNGEPLRQKATARKAPLMLKRQSQSAL